jgi:GNAT superfamily N-acetyltransferase
MNTAGIESAVVRRATSADTEAIVGMLRAHFATAKDVVFNADTQRRGMELLLHDPARFCVVVAETVAGLAGVGVAQTLFSAVDGALGVEVEEVLVHRSWRNRGLEERLVAHLEHWASHIGARVCRVVDTSHTKPILSFYEKLNWESTQMTCLRSRSE